MEIPFIKIDNAGNSYVYIRNEFLARAEIGPARLARLISDRNGGVGSDGLIVVDIVDSGTAGIRIFNIDGSEARLCGNGLRGTVLFMQKAGKSRRVRFKISTNWREYEIELIRSSRSRIESDLSLGGPSFAAADIGYLGAGKICLGVEFDLSDRSPVVYCLAMPNPHAVIFVDNFEFNWQKAGMELEKSSLFKRGLNVMFTRVNSQKRITVYPWERGSGATLSCGSGAAAAAVISRLLGYTERKIEVVMPGGKLHTSWDIEENEVHQSGPSRVVCSGIYQF